MSPEERHRRAIATGLALWSSIPDGKGKATPWFVSLAWAMQGTALIMSFLVMLLYWTLDFPHSDGTIDALNIFEHVVNFVCMAVDFLISRQPFHLVHIYMPMMYASCYLTVNIIYFAASGGDAVYTVLDWSNAGLASSIAGSIVVVVAPLFWVVFYFLFLWRQCCRRYNEVTPGEKPEVHERYAPGDA